MHLPISLRRWFGLLGGSLCLALCLAACAHALNGSAASMSPPAGTPAPPAKAYQVEGEVNSDQRAALERLAGTSTEPVSVLAQSGQVKFLSARVKIANTDAPSASEKALFFLYNNRDLFQMRNIYQSLKFVQRSTDEAGNSILQYRQQFQGVPVHGSGFLLFISQDGTLSWVSADYVPNLQIEVKPTVRSIHAEETALKDLNAEDGRLAAVTSLEIYDPDVWDQDEEETPPRLAWFVTVASEATFQAWLYIVDAQSGEILDRMDMILEADGEITLWILENTDALGIYYQLIMTQDGVVGDENPSLFTLNAFDHARKIYAYYYDTFQRDSYDGKAAPVVILVNAGSCWFYEVAQKPAYCSAFWDPSSKTIYFFGDYTELPDIMNHEFTHAVTGSEVVLEYGGEPRELNEAFSDLFAAFSSQDGSPWQLNWPVEDEDGNTVLRDMQTPQQGFEKDYPSHYDDRYCNRDSLFCPVAEKCPQEMGEYQELYPDCGHVNSLVFSHAAYLMSEEFDARSGIPRKKLQHLYYEVLTNRLQPSTGQKVAAWSLLEACRQNAKGEIEFKQLDSPFSLDECSHIEKAIVTVGLKEAVTLPIISLPTFPSIGDWFSSIGEWLSSGVDELIALVQSKVENLVDQLLLMLQQKIEEASQTLLQQVLQLISEGLQKLLESCCPGFAPLILLPSGLLLSRRRRRG